TLSHIAEVVPTSDCVVTTRPDILSYFGHRSSTYPPAPWTADADFEAKLRSSGCRYVFSIIATDPNRRLSPLYPLARIPGRFDPVMTCAMPDDSFSGPDPVCALVRLKDDGKP